MNVDQTADPAELSALREAFASGGAPLGWDAVRAFEAQHGIVLPEPYRTCVAEMSDGCEQGPPDFGLIPLAELPRDWGAGRAERQLALPFPLTEKWIWDTDEDLDPNEGVPSSVFDHGSIVLGTDGCGMYWHLIVTGPQRGHVWWISGEGAYPFSGDGSSGDGSGFAAWVKHWADGKPW
ncbi:SMI1/KNR4 family protein [Streptomyces sp. NBC_00893]|uniref:SMI1/KNR4 family protein n=1 Tax=Streptomyces sp. NBC_00893 TaxID=2975862 RepID=UPI00224E16F9|nr:SMI1/KNR4 family protein [Streptomyces sp. NBC_00893]MCX4846278.1 SMI1/KNR4 family protein [Streptomyces sp. NBC_00893]